MMRMHLAGAYVQVQGKRNCQPMQRKSIAMPFLMIQMIQVHGSGAIPKGKFTAILTLMIKLCISAEP